MTTPKISEARAPARTAAQKGSLTSNAEAVLPETRAAVGADAEEGDVAEVEEAGEADDDVQAEGDGREDEDVDRDEGVGVAALLDEREGDGRGHGPDDRHLAVACGDLGEPFDQAGLEEGRGGEQDDDQVRDEELRFLVVGVDAEGDDVEAHGEGAGDDEDFGPGGQLPGRGGLAGVVGELVRGEGRDERGDDGDVGAGFEVGDAAEFDGDGDHREQGGGEGAQGQEPDGLAGAGGGEPAEALGAERGEREGGGEERADQGEHLERGGAAVDGEVTGEVGGPRPGEVGAGDRGEAAADDRVQQAALGGARGGGLRGAVGGHGSHARSATRSPSRPCGRTRRTTMRSTNAQTLDQAPPPSCCMPGMSSM